MLNGPLTSSTTEVNFETVDLPEIETFTLKTTVCNQSILGTLFKRVSSWPKLVNVVKIVLRHPIRASPQKSSFSRFNKKVSYKTMVNCLTTLRICVISAIQTLFLGLEVVEKF